MMSTGASTDNRRREARAEKDEARPGQRRITVLLCSVAVVTAVLGVFLRTTQNGFINYDDDVYVTDNLHVQGGINGDSARWALTTFHAGNWHPLTWANHMLDVRMFGLNPAGHHLTSVLLHTATTLLLFLVLRQMTGATWRSFFVAALFGIHPLRVESVAWVAERKDVLSGFFFVLTIWAYHGYAKDRMRERSEFEKNQARAATASQYSVFSEPEPVIGHGYSAVTDQGNEQAELGMRALGFYALAVLFYAFGLMSKPMLVTVPFVLLLIDVWPLRRVTLEGQAGKERTRIRGCVGFFAEKVPFFIMAAGASVLTWMAQRQGNAIESLARLPLLSRLENTFVSFARYLAKLIWPSGLAVFYPNAGHWPLLGVVGAALLLIGLTIWFWRLRRQEPELLVGWFWFVGMLVPVIGLVQVGFQSIADRYTYLPSIGVFIVLVWGLHAWAARYWPRRLSWAAGSGCCVLVIYAGIAWRQSGYWHDSGTLFQHALEVTQRNPIAELHLGSFQLQNGQSGEAVKHLEAAIELEPQLPEPYDALGTALYLQGRRAEAIRQFEHAIALKPDYAIAHFNLAFALQAEGRGAEAVQQFEQALAARPDYAEACSGLGVALAAQGKMDEAIGKFEEAIRMNPRLAVAHYNLGLALLKQGRREQAASEFSRAVLLRPNYVEAQRQLDALKR